MPTIFPITVLVRDLEILQTICRRRDWEFRAGQRRYRWFGRWLDERPLPPGVRAAELGRCDHAISVPGCRYEIGIVQRPGHFQLLWDDDPEGGLERALGPGGGVLWQAYSSEVVRHVVQRHGDHLGRHCDRNGTLRLRVVTAACQSVAHVHVTRSGVTTLWCFADSANEFRYLADALGILRTNEITVVPVDLSSVAV